MAVAGFSIGEAEGLRRALSRKRSEAAIEAVPAAASSKARCAKGVDEKLAHEIYDKVRGFAGFGFPKSHSAAFALLAYQSAVAAPPLPARVPLRAAERAADGLLSTGVARARRATADGM